MDRRKTKIERNKIISEYPPQSNQSNITIFHDSQEWSTDLEGDITEVKIDGKRLNDIHDLTIKIDKMTTVIKASELTATFLAVIAVAGMSAIGSWLATNHEQISSVMNTTRAPILKKNRATS